MKIYAHDNTPADKLKRALELAVDALDQAARRGIPQSPLADIALAVLRVNSEFKKLPREIADGRNSFCRDCDHATTEVEIVHGIGKAARETPVCAVADPLDCPCCKAFGFLSEADIAEKVPSFLRKQVG